MGDTGQLDKLCADAGLLEFLDARGSRPYRHDFVLARMNSQYRRSPRSDGVWRPARHWHCGAETFGILAGKVPRTCPTHAEPVTTILFGSMRYAVCTASSKAITARSLAAVSQPPPRVRRNDDCPETFEGRPHKDARSNCRPAPFGLPPKCSARTRGTGFDGEYFSGIEIA